MQTSNCYSVLQRGNRLSKSVSCAFLNSQWGTWTVDQAKCYDIEYKNPTLTQSCKVVSFRPVIHLSIASYSPIVTGLNRVSQFLFNVCVTSFVLLFVPFALFCCSPSVLSASPPALSIILRLAAVSLQQAAHFVSSSQLHFPIKGLTSHKTTI